MPDSPLLSGRSRCPSCGCFLTSICGGTDTTCSNARCPASWQASERSFDGSMLGAACRQLVGERRPFELPGDCLGCGETFETYGVHDYCPACEDAEDEERVAHAA